MALADYYELLDVDRSASSQVIEKKIRERLLIWSKRTGLPDLDKRQEAERIVTQLGEARQVLLDDAKRSAYDSQLAAAPAPAPQAAPTSGGGDWLDQARRAMAMNDYYTAAYAAREARQHDGNDPEIWSILARANAGLERYEDAVVEAQRAVQLAPNDAENHFTLAQVFEELNNWNAALQCYQAAAQLEPQADLPKIGIATVHMRSGDIFKAIELLEQLLLSTSQPAVVGDYLAMALLDAAEAVPRLREEDGYVITLPTEIDAMRRMLARAHQVVNDQGLRASIAQTRGYVESCARRKFLTWRMFGTGTGKFLLAVTVICGLIALFSGDIGLFLFFGTAAAGLGYLLVRYSSPQQWKVNQWAAARQQQNLYLPRW